MSCGGRIYKGDSITISIPFEISGYTNLSVDYFTTGDTKITKSEDELTVEDGFITAYFDGHDLDLLPDGVIRYTITYQVDGEDAVGSTNTPLYLKTPAGYSAQTIDDIIEEAYQSGYTAGYDDCGGGDCSEVENIAYNSGLTVGYESGYTAGQADCPDCPTCDCTEAYQSGLTVGYNSGYTAGQDDCPDCPACDCTEAYDSGYTQGFLSGFSAGHIYSGSFLETEIEGISIDFTGQESRLFGTTNYGWYIDDKRAFLGCNTEYQGRRMSQFVYRVENSENIVISKVEFYTLTSRIDSMEDLTVTNISINYCWHPRIVSQTKRTEGDYTYVTLEIE